MDKYEKYDSSIDIFPDVSIEPIESITAVESDEEEEVVRPTVRRVQEDIFAVSREISKKNSEKTQPTISEDTESVIIADEPDKMEVIEPKRKGRGKALKKYNAKPRTEKQLAVLEKARLARAKKRELKNNIKMEISPKEKKIEEKIEPVAVVEVEKEKIIPQDINDFDTFSKYMDRYNNNRMSRVTEINDVHPNKIVKKNLLPRPPLIAAERTVQKIKKKVSFMDKPNVYDPMYAINMLSNRGSSRSRFKDPFSR
jgi:hypothetical protein